MSLPQPMRRQKNRGEHTSSGGEPNLLLVHELMTSVEVGQLLRVSQATLCRWREQGVGPRALWLSPRVPRYSWQDVRQWMERSRA